MKRLLIPVSTAMLGLALIATNSESAGAVMSDEPQIVTAISFRSAVSTGMRLWARTTTDPAAAAFFWHMCVEDDCDTVLGEHQTTSAESEPRDFTCSSNSAAWSILHEAHFLENNPKTQQHSGEDDCGDGGGGSS